MFRTLGGVALTSMLLAGVSTTALAAAAPAAQSQPQTVEAVVVTADPLAAVAGDIKPEVQLNAEQIQGYGVGTVTELLGEITAQTQSGDEGPVILLNGRQISGQQEINDIPTEAVQRVDVLPEEASTRFGYSGSQRVVNIVLQPVFKGLTTELSAGVPTEGGRFSGSANVNAFRIQGNDRLNVGVRYQATTALTEDERDLVSRATTPFSTQGNIIGLGTGEIDPALSRLAGSTVTVAGVPDSAATRTPSLADFAATAGKPNADDSGAFRTLQGESQRLNANVVWAKSLSDKMSATLNGSFGANSSKSLRGLPTVSLSLPAGAPYSPFATTTTLDRYVAGLDPLAQQSDSWNSRLAANLRADFGAWRTNLTASYDHTDSLTHTDVGVDATSLQALLNARAASFNPFGPLPTTLPLRPQQKGRNLGDTLNINYLARTTLFRMPAGAVTSSLRVSDRKEWSDSKSLRNGVVNQVDLTRNTLSGQANISVPLTSVRNNVLAAIGDLSVNANVSADKVSNFGTLNTIGGGVNWTPITNLQLRANYSNEDRAPSLTQLGGPVILTPASRVFDYVTGQTVDVLAITGGNPSLRGEQREVLRLSGNFKPFSKLNLTLTATYTNSRTENPVQSFPAITAAVQAAFPDRFVRDAAGNLISVDTRPVNFQRAEQSSLRWGINFTKSFARPGAPGAGGQRPAGAAAGAAGQRQFPQGQGGQAGQAGQRQFGQGAPGQAQAPGGQRPAGQAPVCVPVGSQAAQGQRPQGQAGQAGAAAAAPGQRQGPAAGQGPGQGQGQAQGQRPAQAACPPGTVPQRPFGQAGAGQGQGQGQGQRPGQGQAAQGPGGPGGLPGGPGGEGGPPGGGDFQGPPGGFPGGGDFGGGGFPGGGGDFGGGGGFGGGGFGGAPGGGGPGGGGRGGGGGGGGGGNNLQLALYHTVYFEDRLLIRPGLPALDFLNGSASGSRGGRARHQLELQAGYNRGPFGFRVTTNWQSATTITDTGAGTGTLRFSSLTTSNLRVFANLAQVKSWVEKYPILTNTRLTLSVNNLFNERQKVRDATGVTPLSYQPGYLDPVGREIRLELRKQF